ncbi:glycerophosphocholine phosphodiesterase GPCPD1 [Teleopsis dalmanni]|uniref:glycerophosphocholine phosphodiesterase GPCPD1 n=1 Tax=Teleopsis dalmanni TaxID=139649 RepID=UPI0018CE0BAE|nr:glycerophosphocholine phosphodiesterase GPCPD1 [Teleopsis dalmanni]XP_037959735.1 glycerophosphocholine phosphodiesterase GPCPD1 [Teleopsis dalmanni]
MDKFDEYSSIHTINASLPNTDRNGLYRHNFRVLIRETLLSNEYLAIVGNCSAIGNWKLEGCKIMSKEDEHNVWFANMDLNNKSVEYRYFVCAIDPISEKLIVRRWETHLVPRLLQLQQEQKETCLHIFGVIDDVEKVDRGWLTTETLVQLKFFNAPFTFKQRMKRRLLYVKVTPMHLKIPSTSDNNHLAGSSLLSVEDSLSNDTHDTKENANDAYKSFGFNEVTNLNADDSEIHLQPQFGTVCGSTDLVVFHLTVGDFESTAYLIDFYSYSSKVSRDEPPLHFGYQYVLPNLFKSSEGRLEVPITCASTHRPLGMMRIGYLIVQPVSSLDFDMRVSFSRYWNDKWAGLDVGHRGLGSSFKANDCLIRENTIASLKNAVDHGADMVEFDVQLSKDLVPVVYHDFKIYVSLKSKHTLQENGFLELPVRDLTLDQLKNLKVYHTEEGRSGEVRCFFNDDLQEHQPFPQLSDVLDAIDSHIGFNIEVKWSQKLQDGTMEEEFEPVVDRNSYIDCILDTVWRKGANRRIIFSCFDPDICTMLRFKQNRYPVMFLSLGNTTKYIKYMDPRGNSFETAVFHSLAMELLGIVAHTEDLLRDPTQVNLTKNRGLILFCWGDENNSKDTIKLLKQLGLHAIIYDKMDILTSKEVKRSVFLLEAKESQKELLKMQALEIDKKWHSPTAGSASLNSDVDQI